MLRTRIILSLLPFGAILMAVGLYAIVLFSRLADTFDFTVSQYYQSIVSVQEMVRALQGMEREAWGAADRGLTNRASFDAFTNRFATVLANEMEAISLPGEDALNAELQRGFNILTQGAEEILLAKNPDTRRQIYHQKVLANMMSMDAALEKIRKLNHEAILTTGQSTQKITTEVTRLMIVGIIVALVISAYASFQMGRSILQPIKALTRATRQLGSGDLDHPVPVRSRDELGELAQSFNQMAAQLQEYRRATSNRIMRMHQTMEATLASFPDPIFVLNRHGVIELNNPAAEQLMNELNLQNTLPARLHDIATKVQETGEDFLPHGFSEVMAERIGGVDTYFLPRVLAVRDKDRQLSGVAVVLYDVTRFRLLDAAKTDLVATVSHELKTPLTSVRMTLHLLLEKIIGPLTAKQEDMLQAARNDSERLLRILNDLLDLARLEDGSAELHREDVPPAELLNSVTQELFDSVASADLKLLCTARPGLPLVSVDRQRISHVFSNLVTNAIKYSPPGGTITILAEAASDGKVQFSVRDEGAGIAEEFHARIFDRFYRIPGETKRGVGLGLSIAREITVAHGGRIWLESKPGHGCTFLFTIPGTASASD